MRLRRFTSNCVTKSSGKYGLSMKIIAIGRAIRYVIETAYNVRNVVVS